VAVKVAAFHPDRVDGLVLINPWFSMPTLAKVLHRTATNAGDAGEDAGVAPDDPAQAVDEAFALSDPKTLFDRLEFPNPASLMHLEHIDSVAHYGPQERSVPLDTWTADASSHLADVRCRVVTLFSTEDGTAMPEQAELGLARLPQATTGMVQGGHYPWLDDPDTFFPLLQEALRSVSTP
jgi:pimeloyl-ACP methyl ester carboxylesterase